MHDRKKTNKFVTALQLVLLGILIVVGLNYNALLDQYALATYEPTAEVAAFESRIALTTPARAALYRSDPKYADKATFNIDCETKPNDLELGCYYRGRIYVLRIENDSLAPEMDVVTAHELLHAVWTGLSAGERAKLKPELESIYRGLADKELDERMAGYAKTEPGEETNELHSILATEYEELSPVLEEHYAKYFVDRHQVVARHAAYKDVFESRRQELERELADIRAQKATLASLNRQMDAYKASGQVAAYNALVPRQNRLVESINRQIEAYRAAVDEYNQLSKSLDSQAITDTEPAAQ